MRFYLAGRFERRAELREHAEPLIRMGHFVCSRWLWQEDTRADELLIGPQAARDDLSDVRQCDALVYFADEPGQVFGGGMRHVELGAALALGKVVIVIGLPEHIGHRHPAVLHCPTLADFWKLAGLAALARH